MAQFEPAYKAVLAAEGGHRLINIPGDRGGQTCSGISRKANPSWSGWARIDAGEPPTTEPMKSLTRDLYRNKYWVPLSLGYLDQGPAHLIFSCAVMAGPVTSARMAQRVVGAAVDGIIGPRTIESINALAAEGFCARFTAARVARYVEIVERRPDQRKFFFGWVRRCIREVR